MTVNLTQLTKVLTLLGTATLSATLSHAESHPAPIEDADKPIVALNTLTSLKNAQPVPVNLPTIQRFTTAQGTPVLFVQATTLPIVDVSLQFNAGSARDEAIKKGGFGLASLTASMLQQGTARHDENAIAETTEQLGVKLNTMVYRDMFGLSLRSLSDEKYLLPAIDLMREIVSEPTFPETNLARVKSQYVVGLTENEENPEAIASKTFNENLFGNHPYAHPVDGTIDSIRGIKRSDLQAFAKQFLVARNANIAITGNITRAQAEQLANRLTANLTVGAPAPALPDPKPLADGKRIHIPFDSNQTFIVMGQLGDKVARDAEGLQRQTNVALADDIIGGSGFQARLMKEVRTKRGFTYGIYSSLVPMQSIGSYGIAFSTSNDKAKEAIDVTLDVVKDATTRGVTPQELALNKDSQINSFPLSLANNGAINRRLGMMGFYQLPDSYLTEQVKRINQATLTDVNQSYKTLVDPSRFLIVTVGDAKDTKISKK